jgi:hypothetical protein
MGRQQNTNEKKRQALSKHFESIESRLSIFFARFQRLKHMSRSQTIVYDAAGAW